MSVMNVTPKLDSVNLCTDYAENYEKVQSLYEI